ncbi:AfsR/SARP family transcriptional regulator [Glycomyces algeriensis]|uniref:SARP family transcriptional regulator n=1 Tax=Glycomyces algeriensis TaxID=256037 RepID=A0A9W6LGR9_9ACTN|nr:BTAD domain-containing putative transcriptional regulator [Glycomyces algeriensis]MDA1364161.1 BTAD domain-containing putative transcriptional regulator [Glycomyces algeriensis]MDR7350186.1 DNA-binding SARP family transcriptional activator [Glycomyces algeriensis]GLI42898.1 SARP family transcriptional regulator [Glycomyces algeriensis]
MPASTVEFRALGPVEIAVDGRPEAAFAAKPRTLLALLLLDVNRVAERDWLIDQLWAGDPPNAAHAALRAYAYRLRKHLDQCNGGAALRGRTGGYLLEVEPAAVDVHRFETLTARGRRSLQDGDQANAIAAFQEGLGLWRGMAAFAGVDVPAVRDRARRLDELRLEVTEQYLGAALESGASAGAVPELEALTAAHPLREGFWRLLMLSLYRDGRQGEALEAYQRLYRLLDDELGIRPSIPIEQLHQRILVGDPQLQHRPADQAPVEPRPRPAPVRPVPRQLPAANVHFTGREAQLAELDGLLERPGTVGVLTGTGGIGKTALAIHWAHKAADRFPDGQLYLNLCGFDPSGEPIAPEAAVRSFLDALGVPPEDIPTALETQTALYRSLLADKRLLLVLDNARDDAQVRPLLPGFPGTLVLVTGRHQLTGLLTQGAQAIRLDPLATREAERLLTDRLQGRRIAREPEAAQQIIDACAGLPLALAIVAARAAFRPDFPLAAIAAELADADHRLDALADSDPAIDVRAVFSWSYRALTAEAARLFRLLSVHPEPGFSLAAAAAIAEAPPQRTARLLAELTRANLLDEPVPGRHSFHDLLRAYAAEQADRVDGREDLLAASRRMLDCYLSTAFTATRLLDPHRDPITVTAAPGPAPTPLEDDTAASAWFAAEGTSIAAAVRHAADQGLDVHCWQLAWALRDHLDLGPWHDQAAMWELAIEAARRIPDAAAEVRLSRLLAEAYSHLDRTEDGHALLDAARAQCRTLGDRVGEAHVHLIQARLWMRQQRYDEGIASGRESLALYRAADHLTGQASALNTTGWIHSLAGDHERALARCEQALAILERIGDRHSQAATLDSLGYAHHQLGGYDRALAYFGAALDLYREIGGARGEALVLGSLAETRYAIGDIAGARRTWRESLRLFELLGHRDADKVRARLAELP